MHRKRMSNSNVEIGEAPNRQLGQVIVKALISEGIQARLIERAAGFRIMTPASDAELAKEILAFLKKEIAKQASR